MVKNKQEAQLPLRKQGVSCMHFVWWYCYC